MSRTARRKGTGRLWGLVRRSVTGAGAARLRGLVTAAVGAVLIAILATYHAADPSLDAATSTRPANWLGWPGATVADLAVQLLGLAAWAIALIVVIAGLSRLIARAPLAKRRRRGLRAVCTVLGLAALAGALAWPTPPISWPLADGLGGLAGDGILNLTANPLSFWGLPYAQTIAA